MNLALALFRASEDRKASEEGLVSVTDLAGIRNLIKRLSSLLFTIPPLKGSSAPESIRVMVRVDDGEGSTDDGGRKQELQYSGTFDLLFAVVQAFLDFHADVHRSLFPADDKGRVEELDNGRVRDLLYRRKEVGFVLGTAIKIMGVEMLRDLAEACERKIAEEADQPPTPPNEEVEINEDATGNPFNVDSANTETASHLSRPHSGKDSTILLDAMKRKAQKLIPLADAILANDIEEVTRRGLNLPISVRLAAARVLMDTKMAVRGRPVLMRFPELLKDAEVGAPPASDVQIEMVGLWTFVAEEFGVGNEWSRDWFGGRGKAFRKVLRRRLVGGEDSVLSYFVEEEVSRDGETRTVGMAEEAGRSMIRFGADLGKMMMVGAMDISHAARLLRFYGVDPLCEGEREAEKEKKVGKGEKPEKARIIGPTVEMFGVAWDEICRLISKCLLVDRLDRIAGSCASRGSFEILEKAIGDCSSIVGDALLMSFEAYFSSTMKTLKPAEDLVKLFMTSLHSWPSILDMVQREKDLTGAQSSPAKGKRKQSDDDDPANEPSILIHRDQAGVLSHGFRRIVALAIERVANGIVKKVAEVVGVGLGGGNEEEITKGRKRSIVEVNGTWRVLGAMGGHVA
ncbi:hypothetical protein HDU67_003074, partial [Dinochytrium kinnereticum]